jgi:hypothetical protein
VSIETKDWRLEAITVICDERWLDVGLESAIFHLKIIMLAKIKEQTLRPVLF